MKEATPWSTATFEITRHVESARDGRLPTFTPPDLDTPVERWQVAVERRAPIRAALGDVEEPAVSARGPPRNLIG